MGWGPAHAHERVQDMIRVTVVIVFALSLLCPVFCLAEAAGGCPSHDRPDAENCEAMSFGAVVEKADDGPPAPHRSLPSFDGPLTPGSSAPGPRPGLRPSPRDRGRAKPPPSATRRHALLQTFLF
jgi:hypothetical protein